MTEQKKPPAKRAAKKPAAKRTPRKPPPAAEPAGMRYIVTGCARSGTKYAARMLTRAGLACGHEDVFNRWTATYGLPADWRTDAFTGDSSFTGAPFTGQLSDAGLTVVHQVRPPLDVIRSICGIAWLRDLALPYVAFVAHHVPDVAEQPPGPQRAAAAWLGLNALAAEHAHLTWRAHDIRAADVTALAERIDATVDPATVEQAVRRTPRTINHRARAAVQLADLGPLADPVAEAAERYGVPLEAE